MMENKINKSKAIISGILWNILSIIIVFIFLFPFLYMVLNSLAADDSLILTTTPKLFPSEFRFRNYIDAFVTMNYLQSLGNTLIILVPVTVLNMVGSLLVAYGFARFEGKYKKILFRLLISTMMLPWVVTMVPAFVVFKQIGWVGTRLPLIIPAFGGSAYNIFMMKQFIQSIPRELDDAAKIDGCSSFRILFNILLPNMKPVLVTLFIFLFTAMWSDYIGPSLYLLNDNQKTLSLGLLNFQNNYTTNWNYTLAGSVMFSLPMVIILFVMQKYFVGNSMNSAFK